MRSESGRVLFWNGLVNGRDLGGVPTVDGDIEPGRLVRSASVHTLHPQGWQDLVDYGIRTIIDLRHQWEIDEEPIPRPLRRADVNLQLLPLEPPGYIES